MGTALKVLFIQNREDDIDWVISQLDRHNYKLEYQRADSATALADALNHGAWDLVFLECSQSDFNATTALHILSQRNQHLPALLISGSLGEEAIVDFMLAGARDIITPGNTTCLISAVERELQRSQQSPKPQSTQNEVEHDGPQYHSIVDQIEAIYRCKLDGVIIVANQAFAHLNHVPLDKLIGQNYKDVLPEGNFKYRSAIWQQLSEDKPVIASEHAYQLENGDKVWIQWLDRLIIDSNGNPIEYQGVGRDITEYKRTEKEILSSAENLERYVNQLQVAAEIARDAATARELDKLLNRAVELVKERFGFYHAAVFLLDEANEYAVMTAAAGKAGNELLNQRHKLKVGDLGIVSHVAMTGEPRIALDVDQDKLHLQQPFLPETRSEMAIPLKVMSRIIGVLDVQSKKIADFDGNDLIVLQTMADQLAIAIDNIRLVTETQRRSQELAGLYEAAVATSSVLNIDTLLERLYEQVQRLIKPDTFMVSICNIAQKTFSIVLAIERGEPITEFSNKEYLFSNGGLTGWVLENRKPLLINDIEVDPLPIEPIRRIQPIHAWLGVPLISRGNLLGAISIQSFRPSVFDISHQRFLESLAAQSAVALENANLFDAERIAREKAEALRDAAQMMVSTLSLAEVLDAILEHLARVLPYDSASIYLAEGNRVRIHAGRGYEKYIDPHNLTATTFPIDTTFVQEIVSKGKMLVIPDVHNYPDWIEIPFSEHVRSYLGVPLRVRDQVIGFFSLDRTVPGIFTESELEIAEIFAVQTSAAIENAYLFEAEEKRVASLETLRQVSLKLTASLEPEAVLDAILDGVFKLIPDVQNAHIFTYDGEKITFGSSLWQDGRRGDIYSEPRPNGLTYKTAQTGEMVLVHDLRTHPLYEKIAAQKKMAGAIVGIPVKVGERVVGVLNVAHQTPYAFSEAELYMLRLMSDQAALAIENARLFDQMITERRHIALLYDVGQAISTSLDANRIIKRSLVLTCRALAGNVGAIWTRQSNEDFLTLQALYVHGLSTLNHLDPIDDLCLPLGHSIVGWSAQQELAINIPDVLQDERWGNIPYVDEEVHAMIVAPITDGQNLLGAMTILHGQVAAFTEDHLDLLQSICQQVGLALSNAHKYQDINRLVDLLAAEQNRLESLIEMLPVGVLLLNKDHQLLMSNPLGQEYVSVLSPAPTAQVIPTLGKFPLRELLEARDYQLPLEISIDTPRRRIFEIQASQIKGDMVQWVLTLRDVTIERETQERVQMQERLATVGQLAAGIAHDFNNIMAAIVVYADLLMMEPSLSATSRERLSIIEQQIQRATSLIRQILDFSRRSVMEQSTLHLLSFMKEMQKLLERTLPENIQINLGYHESSYVILADPTRLQQVFMNLAVNARDAMPHGGSLNFYLEPIYLRIDDVPPVMEMASGDWVRISVTDTGIGISPENQSRIFEPFFTTKSVGQGTGLGLAQVYGIVRQHDGYISVKSQPGQGTQFDIYLPALLAEPDKHVPKDEQRVIDGSGKTVLLIEDDSTTRSALQALLEAQRFQVVLASNGTDALKILNTDGDEINLVVSDIVMPEMGGMDLYTIMQIRWPEIQTLFITGHPLDSRSQNTLQRGRVEWLQKPFSIAKFNQSIQKLLERK